VPGTEGAPLRLRVVSASLSYAFLQANKHRVILQYPMGEQEFSTELVFVEVKLEPIGALWTCETDESLNMLAANLLVTLTRVHEHGFVHRDIRKENVVKLRQVFILIDWDLAGPSDETVWWHSTNLPDPVKSGSYPYTTQTDLWQVGRLLKGQMGEQSCMKDFAEKLMTGGFASADEARRAIPWSESHFQEPQGSA
jgi:serine/threonine protein kinase